MTFHGTWRELETGTVFNVAAASPVLWFLTVVDCPATDQRMFEIRGQGGCTQLCPTSHRQSTETETCYDLTPGSPDSATAGRILWRSQMTGKQRTWQRMQQVWNITVVQLMYETDKAGLRLVLRKLTGEKLSRVAIPSLRTTWLDTRMLMVPGLRPLLSKSRLAFVSPRGEVLTRSDDARSLSDILGCGL
jgi:hypothetical protein